MKLTNPIGREVSTGLEAQFEAIRGRACACSGMGNSPDAIYQNYVKGSGGDASCANCGCDCSNNSVVTSGNSSKANGTDRQSTWPT